MKNRPVFSVILLLVSIFFTSTGGFAQPEPIRLKTEKVQNAEWDYYIGKVIDARDPEQVFANLWYKDGSGKLKSYSSDIIGGSKNAISNFMIDGLPRNTGGRQLIIRILECRIRESNENTHVSGLVSLKVQFEFEKDWGIQPLTTYSTSLKYNRSVQSSEYIEPALRKVLANSLKYIYDWVKKESATNVLLAKGLKLSFSNFEEQDMDTVYYQRARLLSFDDFQARPPANARFQAAIFPSFGYDMQREYKEGFILIHINLKVYMMKSASWALAMIKSTYSLNHEQRHFDLVKVIAERFKTKLLSEKLNPDNYEGIINFEYLEFYREMNRLQERYDQETNHGTNRAKQEEWNRKIDAELNAQLIAGTD
ncbi:MAG: hypothetical protein Q8S11_14670 [Daejeonella sp.]|uniref:hypothetical protein n=1 Tax=Daejeonella sp. TaxID=2805397 RepID=UPI002732A164|nr:hypothetical protein [Daejeonella sp.]MDP3469580.1 hypothetical protein [Daejeonella sp.]